MRLLTCLMHKLYRTLLCRIQSVVGLKKEERKLKLEAEKAKDPFDRKDGRKILAPKHLEYALLVPALLEGSTHRRPDDSWDRPVLLRAPGIPRHSCRCLSGEPHAN